MENIPLSVDLYEGASIETSVVARRFSDAATTYDAWSHPLALVANGLAEFLPKEASQVLDVGCGTGLMVSLVRKKYPEARIVGMDPAPGMVELCRKKWRGDPRASFVLSQAEAFSSPPIFDLAVSSSCAHWFSDKAAAVQSIARSMVSGGTVAAAIPVEGNFSEFYDSYTAAMGQPLSWCSSLYVDWRPIFEGAGFSMDQWHVKKLPLLIPEPSYILDFLKGIGTIPIDLSGKTPASICRANRLTEYYQAHFAQEGGVRMTWCVLYCTGTLKSR